MVLFSRHENQLHPPSMSDQGILRSSKKSDVIKCFTRRRVCKIFDGGAFVHSLKPAHFSTFQQYPENILLQYVCAELKNVNRVDIVWDQYFNNKPPEDTTRGKQGRGISRDISPQTAVMSN